jgi:hypothetical protein
LVTGQSCWFHAIALLRIGVDAASCAVTFLCDKIWVAVDLTAASSFSYLDYNDPDPKMMEFFEAGYPAWMRAFVEGQLMLSLHLKDG